MSKRMKSTDNVLAELQRRADDATNELQSSRAEIQRLTAELVHTRASCDEMQVGRDAAVRDNKQLTGLLHIVFIVDTASTE